jgi:c-di-GMP-related signal transduction protein
MMPFGLDSRRTISIARQPILDSKAHVFGHELLYRHAPTALAPPTGADLEAARTLNDAVLSVGLDALSCGLPIFIKLTRPLLLGGAGTLLPPAITVLELGENIVADEEVVQVCQSLRSQGYALALDNFTLSSPSEALLPLVQYAKIDLKRTPAAVWKATADRLIARNIKLVAQKVENAVMAAAALEAGYQLFQGFYFCRPTTFISTQMPARRLAYMQLLGALNRENVSLNEIEDLVKHDLSLSYRVLRAVNSAAFGIEHEVTSMRDALRLLGVSQVRKWASVWAMAGLSEGDASGAVSLSLVRARCCEYVGEMMGQPGRGFFLLGLCSLLDVILRRPMPVALESLPLPATVRDALLGRQNTARTALDTIGHYERGEWDRANEGAERLGLNPDLLPDIYADAIRWARELSQFSAAA